jgi:hypothetical protein
LMAVDFLNHEKIIFSFVIKIYYRIAYNGFGLGEGGDFQLKC